MQQRNYYGTVRVSSCELQNYVVKEKLCKTLLNNLANKVHFPSQAHSFINYEKLQQKYIHTLCQLNEKFLKSSSVGKTIKENQRKFCMIKVSVFRGVLLTKQFLQQKLFLNL